MKTSLKFDSRRAGALWRRCILVSFVPQSEEESGKVLRDGLTLTSGLFMGFVDSWENIEYLQTKRRRVGGKITQKNRGVCGDKRRKTATVRWCGSTERADADGGKMERVVTEGSADTSSKNLPPALCLTRGSRPKKQGSPPLSLSICTSSHPPPSIPPSAAETRQALGSAFP